MMIRRTFWMVVGIGTPIFRHPTRDAARIEAERLAIANPGEEFVVLESVAAVKKHVVQWDIYSESALEDGDVPF